MLQSALPLSFLIHKSILTYTIRKGKWKRNAGSSRRVVNRSRGWSLISIERTCCNWPRLASSAFVASGK